MTPSVRAWLVLAAGIVGWDLIAPRGHTLSEQVDRWLEKYPLATWIVIPIVHPHQRLVGEERKQVAKQLRAEYDDGASIRDLAAQTGYSIQRVRSLLKMTGELRQQGRHIGDGH